jgi:hypothetical protein
LSTISSASSYISSLSRSDTPVSSVGSYAEDIDELFLPTTITTCTSTPNSSRAPRSHKQSSRQREYSPSPMIHIAHHHISHSRGLSGGKHSMLPYEIERIEEKPAKKARTIGSNIFSRFLGGGGVVQSQRAQQCV